MDIIAEKQCLYCGEIKPAAAFNKDKSKQSGIGSYCKACCKTIAAARYRGVEVAPPAYQYVAPSEKACTGCGQIKPLDEFHKASQHRDGHCSKCKKCAIAVAAAHKAKHRKPPVVKVTKPRPQRLPRIKAESMTIDRIDWAARIICKKCGKKKSATCFRVELRNSNGLSGSCKVCDKVQQTTYYQTHRDQVKTRVRSYRLLHIEQIQQRTRRDREQNPGKYKAQRKRRYNQATPIERAIRNAKGREYRKKDYHRDPTKHLAWRHKRMALQRGNGGSFTVNEWRALCAKYDNRCLCCGAQGKLTIDHVIPVTLGGSNDISNLQPLCLSCNVRKYDRTIDYRIDSPYEVK